MKTSPAPKKRTPPAAPTVVSEPPAVIAPDSIALSEIREAAALQSAKIQALLIAPHISEEGMKVMLLGTADFLDGVALK